MTSSDRERQERREQVAREDRELHPLFILTRPTCDEPGVLLHVIRDDGQRPILPGSVSVQGRLTIEQAEGLARDLLFMAQLAREEARQQRPRARRGTLPSPTDEFGVRLDLRQPGGA